MKDYQEFISLILLKTFPKSSQTIKGDFEFETKIDLA